MKNETPVAFSVARMCSFLPGVLQLSAVLVVVLLARGELPLVFAQGSGVVHVDQAYISKGNLLSCVPVECQSDLENGSLSENCRRMFASGGPTKPPVDLSDNPTIVTRVEGKRWRIFDSNQTYLVIRTTTNHFYAGPCIGMPSEVLLMYSAEDGTPEQPFAVFKDGVTAVSAGGTVSISPGHYPAVGTYSKPMTLRALEGGVVLEGFPRLIGNATCPWGSTNCNRCVSNVEDLFRRFDRSPDRYGFGFHIGEHPDPEPGLFVTEHWQGVQRLSASGGRYMVVSRDDIEDEHGDESSGFAVVDTASRNRQGTCYGTNRPNLSPPPPGDRIVRTIPIDRHLQHAGGIQVMGNILAVPIMGGGDPSEVRFFDVANPVEPEPRPEILHRRSTRAYTAALAQLQDGRYLLIVGRDDPYDFYISNEPFSLHFSLFDQWRTREVLGYFQKDYQNINLVTECETGDLYLIGMHNKGWLNPFESDEEFADLFQVRNGAGDGVEVEHKEHVKLWAEYLGNRMCNLDAAGGVYVNPQGQLYLYCTEHDNDGPQGSIKAMEYCPQSMNPMAP